MTTRKEPFYLEYTVCEEWHGSGIAQTQCQRFQGHDRDHGPRLTESDRQRILEAWLGLGTLEARISDVEEALDKNGIYA